MESVGWLDGRRLEAVGDPADHGQWLLTFDGGHTLNLECPWRVTDGRTVCLGRIDHRQLFGLASPVDGVSMLLSLTATRIVESTWVSRHSDLRVEFSGGVRLETFSESSGYESWTLSRPNVPTIVGRGCDE